MRSLVPAALVAALLLMPVPATAAHQVPTEVTLALDYLRSQQDLDGGIGSDATTAWAAIAFARAGIDPGAVSAGGASLEAAVIADTRPTLSVLSTARQVLALVASGADPRTAAGFDAVQGLLDSWDGQQVGFRDALNDDIFVLQALHAAGVATDHPVVQGLRTFILQNQQPSGAWSYGVISPPPLDLVLFHVLFADVDMTGQALVALTATGSAATDAAILRGVLFVKTNQGALDGGCSWNPLSHAFGALEGQVLSSNSDSTAWALMGLRAAGQDPEGLVWTTPTGANLVTFLEGMQQPDGSFAWMPGNPGFSVLSSTAWAAVALAGHDFAA